MANQFFQVWHADHYLYLNTVQRLEIAINSAYFEFIIADF